MTDLRALLSAATPAPWFVVPPPWNEGAPWINAGSEDPHGGTPVCDFVDFRDDVTEMPLSEENAALIVALRNTAEAREDTIDVLREIGKYAASHSGADSQQVCLAALYKVEAEAEAALARLDALTKQEQADV